MVGSVYPVVEAATPDVPPGTHENVAFPCWLIQLAYVTASIPSFVHFQLEGVKLMMV